jgi:hypothetical protein
MNKYLLLFFSFCLFSSCKQQTKISRDFDCSKATFSSLEEITDMKNSFSVSFPEYWKTNLYYDHAQSSIYGADTTKQLTETTILDVALVQKNITFDAVFKLNLEREHLKNNLIKTRSNEEKFQENIAYYSLSKGVKGNYPYRILDLFVKINGQNFLHAKTQVYGDSAVNKRLCRAIDLIEKITFK